MESTTKRLRIGDAIANMFRSILALSPGELKTLSCKNCYELVCIQASGIENSVMQIKLCASFVAHKQWRLVLLETLLGAR